MAQGLPRSSGALLAAVGLVAAAVFFANGSTYAPLVWIGGAAVLAAAAGLALGLWRRLPLPRLDAAGLAFLALLAAFILWNGISIVWSVQPDRSWEYFNRGLVYLAFALLGVFAGGIVSRAPRATALAMLAVFGAALAWALAGKVVPDLYPDGERISRLRAPLGYWNALALLAAMTIPLALWAVGRREHRRALRVAALVLVFVAAVALLLTYSRGGVVVALFAIAASLAVSRERLEAIAALAVSLPAAVALVAWAFTQPGLVEDGQPYDVRLRDGLQFGAGLLVAGAAVAALGVLLVQRERRWRPRVPAGVSGRRLAAGSVVALVVAVLAVSRGDPVGWLRDGVREFTNPVSEAGTGPERLGDLNSNSRWTWWSEAWELFVDRPLGGTGAGTFAVARRPIRRNTTAPTEPHNLALQFLSETGVVGFLLAAGAGGAVIVGVRRALRRLDADDAAAATALAVAGATYLLHALIDYDWDFVGVTAPVLVLLGVLVAAGRPRLSRLHEPLFAATAAMVAVTIVASLAFPWLAQRRVDAAYEAIARGDPDEAVARGGRARTLNPLSIEPLFAQAAGEDARGDERAALVRYVEAVDLQPENPRTWFELGRYELRVGLRDEGIAHLRRSEELDRWGPAWRLLQAGP